MDGGSGERAMVTWAGVLGSMLAALALAGCGGGGGGDRASAVDATPPVLTAIVASVDAAGARIGWATDEPADSQVEYGPTVAYGATTALDAALVLAHDASLAGLSAGSTYHYRVKSRDAAGNLAVSADRSFTTPAAADLTAPVVSISAPAAGAAVAGTVTITASASDDIGVAGVAFRIDGVAAGPEDGSSPYTLRWDTTGVPNGPHSISATARDAAGNAATSAAVVVNVANAAPPPGAAISVGALVVDPPTLETIGLSLPITAGDTNYNATVGVQYRRVGDAAWRDALPLLRVRPDTLSTEDPTPFAVAEQFAGSIFDLAPDTEYEVQLTVSDPDGGSGTRSATVRTRALPPANPAAPRAVAVASLAQLNTALAAALPGDVITLADGVYAGAITVSRSGTAANPIFVRGTSRDGTIVQATGATYGISVSGSHVTVENLTVQASSWGLRLNAASNAVARRLRLRDVSFGIDGRGGSKRDYYICDNLLEGREAQWPEIDAAVWDFEGIVVTGAGHVVCHNTISGFGDALGLHHTTSIPNRAIDFYGNDVLWSGDNCIEMDFTERNVRAFRNRFTNCGIHSISLQPVWGGPAYAIRNVIYNSATAPYKFNNEPTGIYVLHNTAVRSGWAWQQLGARAANFQYLNNLTIGSSNAVDMTTVISLARIDYNGWWPDGTFRFTDTWTSFANLQAASPYEQNGRLLNGLPFATAPAIPASYVTFVAPLDPALRSGSNALDAGLPLPNVNDGFLGAAPDLGALERGAAAPHYGVR